MKEPLHSHVTWPNATEAFRLVESLEALEQHLANLHALKGTPNQGLSAASEVTRLRKENQGLKQRTEGAIARLDALMDKLQPMVDEEETATPATAESQQAA